jgi:hypothetical protein
MNIKWKHFRTIADGEFCEIEGINIWEYKWKSDYETIFVKDPLYGETKSLNRFWIELPNKKVEFVAGEFSNCVWGIYTKTKKGVEIENNREIYEEIKGFLDKYFPENHTESKEYDGCFHITVYSQEKEESSVWFEFDIGNSELIVGYGISHIHYGKQYGIEISEGLNRLLDFFTAKMKRTDYYKGKVNFKNVYELKTENGTYENLGTSSIFSLYPFWKKTTKKVTEHSELIKDKNIKSELEKIRERINNVC